MKRVLKVFGIFALIGSIIAGAYYFLFMRTRSPQVELYFDDGSMLSFPGTSDEAAPFVAAATEILTHSPVAR